MKTKLLLLFFIPVFWCSYLYILFLKYVVPKKNINTTKKKCLFIDSFPFDHSSGHKYRVKNWMEILNNHGWKTNVLTHFRSSKFFFKFSKSSLIPLFFSISLLRRCHQIISVYRYDVVVVRRELLLFNDYGKLFMDKFLLKIHPNVILDFDDDIAAAKQQPKKITNWYGRLLLEDGNKFNNSLRLYKRFIVASNYLRERVLQESPNLPHENILVIPTCVDYDKYPPKQYPEKIEKITFGWIGDSQNYFLLDSIIPTLNQLSNDHEFKLIVIGGKHYKRKANFEIEFIPWSMETEVENLLKIDVGLMPLNNTSISKGKGGFKLIQYMGMGVVSVASNVSINTEIIEDGVNSFLVRNDGDWYDKLRYILKENIDFKNIGIKARNRISENYSFNANKDKYIKFLSD